MPSRSETDSTTRLNNVANAEEGNHGQDEDARDAHQHEVHELGMGRGSSALDLEGGLEADADGGHHPDASQKSAIRNRSPSADSGDAICSIELRTSLLACRGHGQDVEDLVDHARPEFVVLEDEPEDRDEQDRQREEREEHVEADRRRVLRQRSRKRSSIAYARSTT